MQSTVVYDSEYGNTQQVAEAIAAELRVAGPVDMVNVRSTPLMVPTGLDLLVVGGPTQMHHVSAPLRAKLEALPRHCLTNVKLATFDTRAHGPRLLTGAASSGIAKTLKKRGAKMIVEPESFIVAAKEGPLADGELTRAHTWAKHVLERAAVG